MTRRQTVTLPELDIQAGEPYDQEQTDAQREASSIVDEYQPQIDALRGLQLGVDAAPAIPSQSDQAPSSSASADPAEVQRSANSVANSQQTMQSPRPADEPPTPLNDWRRQRLAMDMPQGAGAVTDREYTGLTSSIDRMTDDDVGTSIESLRAQQNESPRADQPQSDNTKAWSSGRDAARPSQGDGVIDPRLAALPSESDVSNAQAWDVPRRILRGLAAGLRGQPSHRPYQGDQLAQQRREGLAQIAQQDMARNAEMERQSAVSERQNRQLEAQRGMVDARMQEQAAARALRERSVAMNEQQGALRGEQMRRSMAEQDALRDPASSISRARRAALMARLASLSPETRAQFSQEAGITPESISTMTAEQVNAILGDGGDQLVRPRTERDPRRRGEGTGVLGAGRVPREEARQTLIAAARDAGLPEGVARTMNEQALQRFITGRASSRAGLPATREQLIEQAVAQGINQETAEQMSTSQLEQEVGADEGALIMPGVRVGRGVDTNPTELRAIRDDLAIAMRATSTLRQINAMIGRWASVSPQDRRAILPLLNSLGSFIAQNSNTGVINGSEWDRFVSAMPNPTDPRQDFLGEAPGLISTYLNQLETNIRSTLRSRGVPNADQDTAMRHVRSGSTGQSMVRVRRRRDGAIAEVPRARWSQLSEEQRAAYEEAE